MNRRTSIKLMLTAFIGGIYPFISHKKAVAQNASPATTIEKAGTVSRVKGRVIAVLDATARPLSPGTPVFIGDVLSTGPGARIEVKMIDGALFILGERTAFNIFDYSFQGGANLNLISGVIDGVSGLIGKQTKQGITINTRLATIGIRGTKFWIGDMKGVFQVAHWSGGGVQVRTEASSVTLSGENVGTIVRSRTGAPTTSMPWGAARMSQAKKMVSF